jgi:preprotein translocase subunit SecE
MSDTTSKRRFEAAGMAFNPGKFLREVRTESAKIVWPTRKETLMTGLMVVIMTSLLAIFFFGVDSLFSVIVKSLLNLIS